MHRAARQFLLAGASALAILAGATAAQADTFTIPGEYLFAAPSAGTYMVDVWGAQGGGSSVDGGGLGRGGRGRCRSAAGEEVLVIVGAQGGFGPAAGGGGGSSAALLSPSPFGGLVAGGGGGGSVSGPGARGVAPAPGGPGAPGYGGGGFDGSPANILVPAPSAVGLAAILARPRVGATSTGAPAGSRLGPAATAAPAFGRRRRLFGRGGRRRNQWWRWRRLGLWRGWWWLLQFRRHALFVGLPVRQRRGQHKFHSGTLDLGDDARRLRRPRLARADAPAQGLARLTRAGAESRCSQPTSSLDHRESGSEQV